MRKTILVSGLLTLAACKLTVPGVDRTQFAPDPTVTPVPPGQVDEASGLVDSRNQPGNLWVNEDSGNPAELTLLGHDGRVKGRVQLPTHTNRDWEEMASGPGPREGVNYLYIGEIGDNNNQYEISQIYRLPEPANLQAAVTQVERINFRYPDGPRDAEAMFVDPQTRDIYIISKRDHNKHLYRLAYPQNINEVTVAEPFGELPSFGDGLAGYVTAAAISPDGQELLVRTYTGLYYWKRAAGQPIADVLQHGNRRALSFRGEPQGEAVCFSRDGGGYYTLSERATAPSVNLYYYARK